MKTLILFLSLLTCSLSLSAAELSVEERLRILEERVESNELEASLGRRLRTSGTLINYAEQMAQQRSGSSLTAEDERHANGLLAATHFQLNFDFTLTQGLSILTSLGMGKIWNNDGRKAIEESSYRSNQGSYGYTGSDAKVDVAYIRWHTPDSAWTFAVGRMTTYGGPPINQLDGFERSGTYPRFGYNAILDGVALVYDWGRHLPKGHSFKTRVFYTPHFFVDTNDRTAPQRDLEDNEVVRRADQGALLNEYEYTGDHFARRTSVYSMLLHYNQFFDSAFQGTNRDTPSYYEGYVKSLFLGFEGLKGTGLNYSVTYLGLMERTSLEPTYYSHSFLHNLNYQFDNWVWGLEYIKTHKNFYIEDYTYLQFNRFYQRGNSEGFHPFATYQIDLYQRIRVGWYHYRAGRAPRYDNDFREKVSNVYLSYRVDF